MRSVNIREVGAAGVAVDLLLETLVVDVAGSVVQGAPFSSPPRPRPPAPPPQPPLTTAASTAAVLPVRFPPVGPPLLRVAVLRAFFPVVTVLIAVEALYPAGVALRMHGNAAAHNRFSVRGGAGQVVCVDVAWCPLDVLQPEVALVVAAVAHVLVLIREALQDPVCEMLVRDDLPMFTEPVPRSICRVQPDIGILSGPQLGVMQ